MAQWMQCDWIQTEPVWADAACSITDTHDGYRRRVVDVEPFDEKRHGEEAQKKERLREAIEFAMYGPPMPEAEVLAEAARPFAERLESGRVQVDWQKVEADAAVRVELLRMVEALEARIRDDEDEEEVSFLLLH